MIKNIDFSLQFGRFPAVAQHRAALPRNVVLRCIKQAMQADVESAEITVRIVDEAEGLALNTSYRHKNYATNVLTFDYTPAPHVSADLVLCAPVVLREAVEQGKTLTAHYAHLIVHGALHAQGFDHESSASDALKMEALEVNILVGLGFSNPYF